MMLIDTSMVMRRCMAKLDFLENSNGVKTGLEYGSLRILESLEKGYPDHPIVLCLDDTVSWRKNWNSDYKASRKPLDDDTRKRLNKFVDFLKCIYPTSQCRFQEADDVLFALSRSQSGSHYIYTNDQDLLQAVSDTLGVKVLKSWNSKLFIWDEAKVKAEFGVSPDLLPYYRAFIGDKSDHLTGVKRLDRVLLAELIMWCYSKKNMTQHWFLQEIKTADWGSAKITADVTRFIDSEHWLDNFMLMALQCDDTIKIDEPIKDDEYVVHCLNEWEIASLRLCERFKDKLINTLSEEF